MLLSCQDAQPSARWSKMVNVHELLWGRPVGYAHGLGHETGTWCSFLLCHIRKILHELKESTWSSQHNAWLRAQYSVFSVVSYCFHLWTPRSGVKLYSSLCLFYYETVLWFPRKSNHEKNIQTNQCHSANSFTVVFCRVFRAKQIIFHQIFDYFVPCFNYPLNPFSCASLYLLIVTASLSQT